MTGALASTYPILGGAIYLFGLLKYEEIKSNVISEITL